MNLDEFKQSIAFEQGSKKGEAKEEKKTQDSISFLQTEN